jgi:pimeloyl-ACP methyl ester carboxylesterase
VRAEGVEAIADAGIGRWLTEDFIAREPEKTAAVRAMLVATPDEGYAGCCAAIEHMDLIPELGAVRAPTLVIAGRQDPATPPEHGERIASAVADARLEVVADARHLAAVEQPRAMTELIVGHLLG